jgi:general secretion pathway protein G
MNTQPNRPTPFHPARGFSLIEILVVIVLIGGILALVASKVFGNKERAEYKLAETRMQTLVQKIDSYQLDVGAYPETLDALVTAPANASGWLGPYAKADELKDPWQRAIEYRQPGEGDKPYQLTSLGADGKAGGEGVKADIIAP